MSSARFLRLGNFIPQALGARFLEIWQEIRADISPIVSSALQGQSNYFEDLPLVINRTGHPEDAWFTFSYSPVLDDQGVIAGLFCSAIETTHAVRDRKLRQFQLDLANKLHPLTSPDAVVSNAVEMLAEHLDASGCWYAEVDVTDRTFRTKSGWFRHHFVKPVNYQLLFKVLAEVKSSNS